MLRSSSSSHSSVCSAQNSAEQPSVSPKSTIVLDGAPVAVVVVVVDGGAVVEADVVGVVDVDDVVDGTVGEGVASGASEHPAASTNSPTANAARCFSGVGGPWRCA